MARILVSFSSHLNDNGVFRLSSFYDGFLRALIKSGNEIMAFNSAEYLIKSWFGDNEMHPWLSSEDVVADVKNFNPELIIAFNNSIPVVILNCTSCPVAVWDADSIQFYNDQNYIKKNLERYTFLCFSHAGVANAIKFGAPPDKVHFIQAGTDVKAEKIPITKNISFIGTNFTAPESFIDLLKNHDIKMIKIVVDEMNKNFYADQDAILKKFDAEWMLEHVKSTALSTLSAVQNRVSILNNVHDLGLTIYGTRDWLDVARYLPWLGMCFNPEIVYSLEHNQNIYNSSKVCLNISHNQAADGFPWRVMDIMASNGCLVSDKKSGLIDFARGYLDIPMYESPAEAAALCQKLLKDEKWRHDLVIASQHCIAEKGQWHYRFEELSKIFAINMTPAKIDDYKVKSDEILQASYIYQPKYGPVFSKLLKLSAKIIPMPILILTNKFLNLFGLRVYSKLASTDRP